jgi:hypothetical protein
MNNKLYLLIAVISLSGCARQSEQNPEQYAKSLETAKTIIKHNTGINKYERYYNAPNHKAWAKSKVSGAWSYTADHYSKESAMEEVLKRCNNNLLKKYDAITEEISCEIINVDNEWINSAK